MKTKRCKTKFCRGVPSPGAKSPLCPKCKHRQFKERNPLRYFWTLLKSRARERGKEFGLSFEVYRKFALQSGYFEHKGKTSGSLSIDRIDNSRGYFEDNIRAITLGENARRNYVPRLREYAAQHGVEL
jgi:hypothetical protein